MMIRFLDAVTRPFFEIRPGERKKTLLMFLYFFISISLIYILKPVRSSLFLGEFNAEKLPYVYIGEAFWLIFVVWGYTHIAKRLSKLSLYVGVLIFMILNLVAFRVLLLTQLPYLSAIFYIWVASFSIVMTTVFWTLANDIFNPSEAKRLFGLIISGGSLGGILGGVITNQLVRYVGTENLLLAAAALLFGCIFFVFLLRREISGDSAAPASPEMKKASAEDDELAKKSILKIFRASSYLIMLALIVIIAKVSSAIVDAQFSKVVEMTIADKHDRTAYFGSFWAWLNGISFCMQFFVTTFLLRYFGVGFSLWFLPVGLSAFCLASVFYPMLWMSQLLRIFDGSANYSVQLASKETLYLPLSSALRHRVKPVIDMLGFRTAKALGGFYILWAAAFFSIPYEKLGILILALIPLWCYLAWRMKKGYSSLLRDHLLNRRQYDKAIETRDATDVLSFLHNEKGFEEVRNFMNHRSTFARKLAAAASYTYERSDKDMKFAERVVSDMVEREAVEEENDVSKDMIEKRDAAFLGKLIGLDGEATQDSIQAMTRSREQEILMKISEAIRDADQGLETKRKAIAILEYFPKQDTVDLLLHRLAGRQEHVLRYIMLKTLNRIVRHNPKVKINRFLVKSEIAREMTIYNQILKIQTFYQKQKSGISDDYVNTALQALLDESRERNFQCLKLLYPQEAIAAIHDEISSNRAGNQNAKAHAVELLMNTLEPDVLIMVQKILEKDEPAKYREEDIKVILSSFLKSQDHWFSLIAHFLIADLKLNEKWPDLDMKKAGSESPF